MLDKILNFFKQYFNETEMEERIKSIGKYRVVSVGLNSLLKKKCFSPDELRKEISLYTKRIISVSEFNQLLDFDRAEYSTLLYER